MYPCPPPLSTEKYPVMTSQVILADVQDTLTPRAIEYLDKLRDDEVELLLTIPSGTKTASSGSAVVLTVKQNKEVVNRKVADMSKPDWEKLQAQGVDVVEFV
ncbi:uncharacterized protein LOC113234398 [Hyposmocoma kahamanoa]|uniref:uncharacterized protein LOC113234398 n=1 Tax=Hyposmocoma kahamanoa TaxID=1477025 RepID=UPI000E6D745A|nr:uncharacterized protein LOC113234398 [Hyposmocoma kahamanoa]